MYTIGKKKKTIFLPTFEVTAHVSKAGLNGVDLVWPHFGVRALVVLGFNHFGQIIINLLNLLLETN